MATKWDLTAKEPSLYQKFQSENCVTFDQFSAMYAETHKQTLTVADGNLQNGDESVSSFRYFAAFHVLSFTLM